MSPEPPGLSRSVEDYLKAIYSLGAPGEGVSTSAIAEALEVQPASVTGMVKRLAESGFLEHAPYRGVSLTEAGIREALRILRRHRILESYLTQRLGFSWEEVHQEAELLEHAASDALIERMAAALENPSHDPHGAPIPTPDGEIEATDSATLASAHLEEEVRVRAVRDDHREGLRELEAAGLLPGARVRVVGRNVSRRLLRIRVGPPSGESQVVSFSLAERVFVVPALGAGQGAGGAGPDAANAAPGAAAAGPGAAAAGPGAGPLAAGPGATPPAAGPGTTAPGEEGAP